MNRHRSFTLRDVIVLLLLVAVSAPGSLGCSLFREPVPPGFERITLRAQVDRNDQGKVEGDLAAHSTLKGVLVGSIVGAPSFGLTGGGIGTGVGFLACAPTLFLYPLCVFAAAVTGAVIGAAVGLVGGGVMGGITGLPSKTAKQVTARLSRLEEGRNFDEELLRAVRAAIPESKQGEGTDAEAVVTARLEEFDLRQHTKDRLSVRLHASMLQQWRPAGEEPKQNTCEYQYKSEKKPAEAWLAEDGAAFGDAVTQGLQAIARWMNRDLEAFAAKQQLPKTDSEPPTCFRVRRWYHFFAL